MITQVNAPSFAGDQRVGKFENTYLPMQIFQKPVWQEMLWHQANKWYLQSLIEKVGGRLSPVAANEIYWAEMGKLYHKEEVVAVTAGGPGIFTIEYNETEQYFIVDDVVDLGVAYPGGLGRNQNAVVTAIGTNGANQTVTVELIDPQGVATLAVGDMPAGHQISLKYNRKGECWQIPEGRKNNPDRFSTQGAKITNTYQACDDAENQQIWFKSRKGRHYWVDEEEYNVMALHRMHVDSYLLFGEQESFTEAGTNYTGVAGYGLIPLISQGGYTATFGGSVLESDIIDMLTELGIYSSSSTNAEWEVLCGPTFYRDFHIAMRDYFVGGGVQFGAFGYGKSKDSGNTVGINVRKYQFGNKCLKLMEYDGFADPDFLPQNANSTDFRNFSLWLNLKRGGIKTGYKKRRRGDVMKDWISYKLGPTLAGRGEAVTDDRACATTNYFTHVFLQVKGLNDHGILAGV